MSKSQGNQPRMPATKLKHLQKKMQKLSAGRGQAGNQASPFGPKSNTKSKKK